MGKKKDILDALLADCLASGDMVFDNKKVRELGEERDFTNQFDVTKLDNKKAVSPMMIERDYFLVHLGKGRHQFVSGIDLAFHRFEEMPQGAAKVWEYRQSVLNEVNTSESNILSVAGNQGVLRDFLYGDKNAAGVNTYGAHRTKITAAYTIGGAAVETEQMQIEIDMTCEKDGRVTVIEGKNGFPPEFATYQIFSPHLYYLQMQERPNSKIKEVDCCYILREKDGGDSILRMYLYAFDGAEMASISLKQQAEYRLKKK